VSAEEFAEEFVCYEVRSSCFRCGRFIKPDAVRCEDFRDDGYYYGIRTEVEYDCSRCGTVQGDPAVVAVREMKFPAEVAT
jgi:hypothetical protein